MSRFFAPLLICLCAVSVAAQNQVRPSAAPPNPWTVSVVHTVDFANLVEWMKRQGNDRLAVPASPPAFVYNFATGMVIDDQGHVVTRLVNLTPLDKDPVVTVTAADGIAHHAKLIGVDGATGFAVLEVSSLKSGTPTVAPANDLNDGKRVQIFSTDVYQQMQVTPEGTRVVYSPGITVAQGTIGPSSIYAKARGAMTVYSGGFLSRNDSSIVLTPENQVVGIAQYAGFGRAYLFPLSFIRDTVARRVIEKKGFVPAGWLGARGDSISQLTDAEFAPLGLPTRAGVVLRQVAPDSAAAACGMQPGDVIISVDGFNIAGAADLIALLTMSPEGRKVTIRASRNHEQRECTAALGARPESEWRIGFDPIEQQLEPPDVQRAQLEKRFEELKQRHQEFQAIKPPTRKSAEALRELDFEIRSVLEALRAIQMANPQPPPTNQDVTDEIRGFVVSDMNEQLAEALAKVKGGVLVKRVAPDSLAARTGLKAGDVIVSAQEQELTSVDQLVKLLNAKTSKLTLKVIRNNQPVTILFVSN
jgi:S1-C subfamily serine protease